MRRAWQSAHAPLPIGGPHEASGSIVVLPLHEGLQLFSCTQFKHGLAIGFLKILQLLLILGVNVEGIGTQAILHPSLGIFNPSLNLGGDRS